MMDAIIIITKVIVVLFAVKGVIHFFNPQFKSLGKKEDPIMISENLEKISGLLLSNIDVVDTNKLYTKDGIKEFNSVDLGILLIDTCRLDDRNKYTTELLSVALNYATTSTRLWSRINNYVYTERVDSGNGYCSDIEVDTYIEWLFKYEGNKIEGVMSKESYEQMLKDNLVATELAYKEALVQSHKI